MNKFKKTIGSNIGQAVVALFSSNILIMLIGVILNFVQGRFVTPEDFGYFKQFTIVSGYAFFLHLGVFHAIEKMYPYYIGRDQKDKAIAVAEIGNAWILIVCFSVSTVFSVLSLYYLFIGNWKAGLGWAAQIVLLFVNLYGGYLSAIYRSGNDFKKMAKSQLYGPLISVITIPIFWVQSYVALFIRSITSIFSLIKLYKDRPLRVKWRFNLKELKHIISQGLPRFTASYITTTGLVTLRSTIIIKLMNVEQLGLWSFSWAITTMAQQLTQAITAVFIPKIIEIYGKTHSIKQTLTYSFKAVKAGVIALVLMVPSSIIITIYLLPKILPMYSETTSIIVLLLISLPLRLIEAPAILLNAANKLGWLNFSAIVNSITQIISTLLGIYLGYGIISIAMGYFIGNLIRVLIIVFILRNEVIKENKLNRGDGR